MDDDEPGGRLGSLYHPEAALFCLCWAAIAASGFLLQGWFAGSLLSIGFMALIMPVSATILTRTEDFALERTVRWSLLIAAGAILALVDALTG